MVCLVTSSSCYFPHIYHHVSLPCKLTRVLAVFANTILYFIILYFTLLYFIFLYSMYSSVRFPHEVSILSPTPIASVRIIRHIWLSIGAVYPAAAVLQDHAT